MKPIFIQPEGLNYTRLMFKNFTELKEKCASNGMNLEAIEKGQHWKLLKPQTRVNIHTKTGRCFQKDCPILKEK